MWVNVVLVYRIQYKIELSVMVVLFFIYKLLRLVHTAIKVVLIVIKPLNQNYARESTLHAAIAGS